MLDIRTIRSQPERVIEAMKNRNGKADIEGLLRLDNERRASFLKRTR
jgi:seryl-tRNA synthetase